MGEIFVCFHIPLQLQGSHRVREVRESQGESGKKFLFRKSQGKSWKMSSLENGQGK